MKHRGLVGRLFPRISPQITQTERFFWYQSFPELGRNSWTITIFCFAQNPLRRNRLFEVGMRCPVLSLPFEVLHMAMLPAWRNCWVKQKWTSTCSSISIHFPQGKSLWTSLKMDTQLGSPDSPDSPDSRIWWRFYSTTSRRVGHMAKRRSAESDLVGLAVGRIPHSQSPFFDRLPNMC